MGLSRTKTDNHLWDGPFFRMVSKFEQRQEHHISIHYAPAKFDACSSLNGRRVSGITNHMQIQNTL